MANLTNIITTVILVAMIGVGLFLTVIEISNNYDTPRGADFNDTFNEFEENFDSITSTTSDVQNLSKGTSASQTTTSGFSFSNAIASLKLVWNFFEFIENLIVQTAKVIGIPAYFVIGFLSIITITITFLFLKAVFGTKV